MHRPFPWWYPVGAQLVSGGATFRVWAPSHKKISVVINNSEHELALEKDGYFSTKVAGAAEGDTYSFLIDEKGPYPDPASRFQPEGPHGPSQLVDPEQFSWTDHKWQGVHVAGAVIYELHVGTFTPEGTWQAATQQLPEVASLGVTILEVMPVAEFSGTYGWGYDGVDLFAPTHNYGSPEDFRAFVDAAHSHGLGVLLDVVYNHLGPDGNFLPAFSGDYFSAAHKTDWGEALNFDSKNCGPVREFFAANAAYWIKEFHLDGLRLDATQNIYDSSKDHLLAVIARNARKAAGKRSIILVAENEPQDTTLVRPETEGGYGLDAIWNDDFHHSMMVAATGSREAYFNDYLGSPQELLSALKYGFLYQGQWYSWQKHGRGTSTRKIHASAFVAFSQNHDQVANSGRGQRLDKLTDFGRMKALTTLVLLGPGTPMLFQGQEFASSAPFLFFADHDPELAKLVRNGRVEFLGQWRSLAARQLEYDDPCSRATFEKCKLNFSERETHGDVYRLHRDLLKLRKNEIVFLKEQPRLDGEVLGVESFLVRFFGDDETHDRLLLINLGTELRLVPSPQPLLAPPSGHRWTPVLHTENPLYGGNGMASPQTDSYWIITAHAAVVLRPEPLNKKRSKS